jgi:hypothetical protein
MTVADPPDVLLSRRLLDGRVHQLDEGREEVQQGQRHAQDERATPTSAALVAATMAMPRV